MATLPTDDGHVPGLTTMCGGWTWAIPANAKNKEGGVELLKALCSYKGIYERVMYTGEVSPRTDVAQDEKYLAQSPSSTKYTAEQLKFGHFRPSVDGYSSITMAFTQAVEDVAFGNATSDEAIATLQAEMIRQFGEDKVEIK